MFGSFDVCLGWVLMLDGWLVLGGYGFINLGVSAVWLFVGFSLLVVFLVAVVLA